MKEAPFISIIMPCYNAASTLKVAVNSIYKQNLLVTFEVILVDDGSTDETREIIKEYAKRDERVRFVFHDKNRGGGAARNTAIEHARGKLIFCLDSDDILPEHMLPRLIARLEETNADGALFEETRFFSGDHTDTENVKNKKLEEPVTLEDMFKTGEGFYVRVNFLYTKDAWGRAGGYPTHHGFDTQDFGFRFLAAGLRAYVTPGTHYLHRRNEGASYFDREYRSGKFSLNTYLVYEDIFSLLSPHIREEIINFDIFAHRSLGKKNLESFIVSLYQDNPSEFFNKHTRSNDPSTTFAKAISELREASYEGALKLFQSLKNTYPRSVVLCMNICRAELGMTGMESKQITENVYNTFSRVGIFSSIRRLFRI